MGLGRNQKARTQSPPFIPSSHLQLSCPRAGAAPWKKHNSRLSCCRKVFTRQTGVSLMPAGQGEGRGHTPRGSGVASLAGGLSLNALKAGPSDRLKGGPPTRASGPSFMAMPPPDTENVALCSHGCLGDSRDAEGGGGRGRALRKEGVCVVEKEGVRQCGGPRNFWALLGGVWRQ